MSDITTHYIDLKSISKNTKLVDTYFPSKYGFSPYRACQHACKYCDGRAEKYYVEGDFERDIVIRRNVPQLLDEKLKKNREKAIVGIGSGVSDPYQPIEKQEKLMEQCANVLIKHKFPAYVMTKSALILRDIDLWEEVHKNAGFTLYVSLTFTDDESRKIIEPGASAVEERFEILQTFKKRGMNVGVLAMPFIPFITDTSDNLTRLFQKLKQVPVDFVMSGGLTLRPGKQKNIFMDLIRRDFPDLVPKYKKLYHKNLKSGSPINSYDRQLRDKVAAIQDPLKIPWMVPHYVYKDQFPIYDEIFILLNHMKELYYSLKGIDISRLKEASKCYARWLLDEKTYFNRRRKLEQTYLEDKLIFLIKTNQMIEIVKNPKLCAFIEQIVIQRKTFDYFKLVTD